jgi:hypothetical protein
MIPKSIKHHVLQSFHREKGCPHFLSPKAVRYAWSGNPYVTLYNRQGLPAPAFRTGDWPWLSEGRKPK